MLRQEIAHSRPLCQIRQYSCVDHQQPRVLLPRVLRCDVFKVLHGCTGPKRLEFLQFQIIDVHTHPTTLVIQIMISQLIIGYRTWAITRRSRKLGLFLLGFGSIVTALEWYSTVDGRTPAQVEVSFPIARSLVNSEATNDNYFCFKGK